MRITNGILINNSLSNINSNKATLDKLNTQLASKKKITRPSDDPIVAIRALRFRSTLSEIDQYLNKNIPDADAWLTCTDDAMGNIVGLLGDITTYCNQAVQGYLESSNKNAILETLKVYRDQIYGDANADYAGRTIFTGYKTDSTLTFLKDNDKKYTITEKFDKNDLDIVEKIINGLDVSSVTTGNIGSVNTGAIALSQKVQSYRLRLAYDNVKEENGLTIQTDSGTSYTSALKKSTDADAYRPGDDEVYYLADTGEVIMGRNVYDALNGEDGFSFTYTREGFKKDELDPTQYFDCVDVTDPANTITYTNANQEIYYEVNFNQSLKINTQGKDVYNQDMTRDLDDIISAVENVTRIENKKKSLQTIYDSTAEGSTEREKAQKLLDICDRELDFANDIMEQAFEHGITAFQKHQDTVSLARADVGARQKRLELCESRLSSQEITVKKLKSSNEDVNVTNVAVELKEASSIYDASLSAAAKVVQKKLLDFL